MKKIIAMVLLLVSITTSVVLAGGIDEPEVKVETANEYEIAIIQNLKQQRLAHEFAELARHFGLPEDSESVVKAQEQWWAADEIIKANRAQLDEIAMIESQNSECYCEEEIND